MKQIQVLLMLALLCAPAMIRAASSLPDHEKWRLHSKLSAAKGEFKDALDKSRDALAAAQAAYGETHAAIIPYVMNLAMMNRHNGHYTKSEQGYLWALGLAVYAEAENIDLRAQIEGDLGGLYVDLGKWTAALPLLLGAAEKSPSAPRFEAVARMYKRLKQYDNAVKACDKGLATGKPDPDTGSRLLVLKASIVAGIAEPDESSKLLEQALKIRERSYNEGHHRIADIWDAMGGDKLILSEKIRRGTIGPAMWESMDLIARAADLYDKLENFEKVLELRKQLLEIHLKAHGENHAATAAARMALAKSLLKLNRKSEAEKEWKRGWTIAVNALGGDHPGLQGRSLNE